MACCQATADTKPIERFMIKAKSQFACDPRVIRALRERDKFINSLSENEGGGGGHWITRNIHTSRLKRSSKGLEERFPLIGETSSSIFGTLSSQDEFVDDGERRRVKSGSKTSSKAGKINV